MANLTLIYGMQLLPEGEAITVSDARIHLKSGKESRVAMHVIEGTQEEIRDQLNRRLDVFFSRFPEV
ncbi:MAG: allantoinase [Acidobacteria bacterium]|nr:allantoinase [Acidobacteriota bacterium]